MICNQCKEEKHRGADINKVWFCVDCWGPLIAQEIANKMKDSNYTARFVKSDEK